MKELTENQMSAIQGGKFWGPGSTTQQPAGQGMGQMCWTCHEYFVFWINVGSCDWEECQPGNYVN
ncbi:MAG: bacteriocin [Bacteroidetes bacterium]|nr:bacteriocin [Bacteroidota bacterium]